MTHRQTETGLVELGVASTATQGQLSGNAPEPFGLYYKPPIG